MNFLSNLVNRAQHSLLGQGVSAAGNAITNIPRALVESPGERLGQQSVNQAAQSYQYTPQFRQQIMNTHPAVDQQTSVNGEAAGGYNQSNNSGFFGRWNSLHIAAKSNNPDTVTHEGLHSVWPKLNPQQRQDFLSKAQQAIGTNNTAQQVVGQPIQANQMKLGVTYPIVSGRRYAPESVRPEQASDLAKYLNSSLGNNKKLYPQYNGVNSLDNLAQLPDDLQTEIHSYIPNYYASKHTPMPPELSRYYSGYFNPNKMGRY